MHDIVMCYIVTANWIHIIADGLIGFLGQKRIIFQALYFNKLNAIWFFSDSGGIEGAKPKLI